MKVYIEEIVTGEKWLLLEIPNIRMPDNYKLTVKY